MSKEQILKRWVMFFSADPTNNSTLRDDVLEAMEEYAKPFIEALEKIAKDEMLTSEIINYSREVLSTNK